MNPHVALGHPAPIAAEVVDRLRSVGVRLRGLVSQTPKSILADGIFEDRRVAVKILRDGLEDFWISAWHREIHVNQTFLSPETLVPVAFPRLLYTDHTATMVFDWVDGRHLDDDRYPQRRLTEPETDTVLSTISAINQWRPPPASGIGPLVDYPAKVTRYHRLGLLTEHDRAALLQLLPAAGAADQFNHADLLPTNLMLLESVATVIDWEFAGLYLPGYDLALAYTLLGAATPAIRPSIDAIVTNAGIEISFAVNLATIVVREIRMHREMPHDSPLRTHILTALEPVLQQARHRLQTLARS